MEQKQAFFTQKHFKGERMEYTGKSYAPPKVDCSNENHLGKTLREMRLEKKMSQVKAAQLAGITQSQWSAYELGKTNLTFDAILRIAKAIKIDPSELLRRSLDKVKYFADHHEGQLSSNKKDNAGAKSKKQNEASSKKQLKALT